MGDVRAEAEGVPPRDMENSDTGPSYIPLGTALRTASYRTNNKGCGEERTKEAGTSKRFNVTKSTPV